MSRHRGAKHRRRYELLGGISLLSPEYLFRSDGPAHTLVRLDASGVPLLASITRLSHDRLQLRPGLLVHAQVKATALGD